MYLSFLRDGFFKKIFLSKKITVNILFLCLDKILRLGIGALVFAQLARYLGPNQFGIINYALAFISFFVTLSTLGLDSIVVKELVKFPENRNQILGSAFFLRLVSGAICIVACIFLCFFFKRNDSIILSSISILSFNILFQSLDIIDYYYQSEVSSKIVVFSRNISFAISSFLKLLFIYLKLDLIYFVMSITIESMLAGIFMLWMYHYKRNSVLNWSLDMSVSKKLLIDSWPMMISSLFIVLYMRIDQIMIGDLMGTASVGIYTAAVKISELWYFIPMSIANSFFPLLLEKKKENQDDYLQLMKKLYQLMFGLAIIVAIVTTPLSKYIIYIIYGNKYIDAGPVLSLHIWTGIFVCIGITNSCWTMAEGLQKYAFYRTCIGAIINILLNLILIKWCGVLGAAIATIFASLTTALSVFIFDKTRPVGKLLLESLAIYKFNRMN